MPPKRLKRRESKKNRKLKQLASLLRKQRRRESKKSKKLKLLDSLLRKLKRNELKKKLKLPGFKQRRKLRKLRPLELLRKKLQH